MEIIYEQNVKIWEHSAFFSGENMIPVAFLGVRSPHASVLVIYHTIHQTQMPSLLSTTGIPVASSSTLAKPAEWSM